MLTINLTRTEYELLVKSIDTVKLAGWPDVDDRVRVSGLTQQHEKAIATLRAEGWRGGMRS